MNGRPLSYENLLRTVGRGDRTLLIGPGAKAIAVQVMGSKDTGQILAIPGFPIEEDGSFDTLVLLEPVPHTAEAVALLREARESLAEDGILVAGFRNGTYPNVLDAFRSDRPASAPNGTGWPEHVARYSRTGIEVVLSRAGLDILSVMGVQESDTHEPKAWIVQAQPSCARASPFGEARKARQAEAREANTRGETLFAQGDVVKALGAFADAVKLWNEDAVYFNNLATVLDGLGYSEEAWRRIREAFHLDSSLPAIRSNMEMIAARTGHIDEADELLVMFPGKGV